MSSKVSSIKDIINLMLSNPSLAKQLKENPSAVAKTFGVSLTAGEAAAISDNLNIDDVLKTAKEVDSYAAKVAAGMGLKKGKKTK